MGRITLVTGGVRSGKSRFGEGLLEGRDDVLYIATSVITDEEMSQRVKHHQAARNSRWKTFEGYRNLDVAVSGTECRAIMLECVSTMITNLIFDRAGEVAQSEDKLSLARNGDLTEVIEGFSGNEVKKLEEFIRGQFTQFIQACRAGGKDAVIITNEVGFSLVSEYKLGRIFTDISGRVNQQLGSLCDEAYLIVSGLPLKLK